MSNELNLNPQIDAKDFDNAICSCGCHIFFTVKVKCKHVPAMYSKSGKLGEIICSEMDVCIACHKPLHITALEYVQQKTKESEIIKDVATEVKKLIIN
jgi:hypothetical protein